MVYTLYNNGVVASGIFSQVGSNYYITPDVSTIAGNIYHL